MTARIAFGSIVIMSILALPAFAGGKGDLQKYFSNAATRAIATAAPAEKRQILDESFRIVSSAIDIAKNMPFISKDDIAGLNRFKAALQEKQEELAGTNGFTRVPDAQLNAFSNYVVQDMEQADEIITISLLTLVLIIILVVLLV